MAPVYSTLFVSDHGVDTDTVALYTFPDTATVFVIRTMDVFLAGVGGGSFDVYDNHGSTFWSVLSAESGTGFWEHWDGRQVFYPGDTISFAPTTLDPFGHGDWRVSGYSLT